LWGRPSALDRLYTSAMVDPQSPAAPLSLPQEGVPFLRRVKIRNYKSIGKADVELGHLTILVGRNGSGKSNFLDALRFVADSLQTSVDHAIKSRGGIEAVRRRSTGHPRNFAIVLEALLPGWQTAVYGFEITARQRGGFSIRHESLLIKSPLGANVGSYEVESGKVVNASVDNMPPGFPDRLYLVTASGLPQFRAIYDALASMGFYNLNPDAMKELQSADAGELLHRDGSNVGSVIGRLSVDQPKIVTRIESYLGTIVPGVTEVERISLGPRETLQFKQRVVGSPHPWKFFAASMSDGTLRALGTLVAVTQLAERNIPVSLVGIEEPETALHPAAAGALMDALREAASHTQVLVTSHSPDLLDQVSLETDRLLAVLSQEGTTMVAPIDKASREAIRDHLYTPGELLRLDQLEPDREDLERQEQMKLFPDEEGDA
jgi:predicted ATPase